MTVGKTRQDPDNFLAVGGFAGVRHDKQLHDDVIDVPGGCLDDVDILASDTLLNKINRVEEERKYKAKERSGVATEPIILYVNAGILM